MTNEYIKAFVIGSSFLVFLPFFYEVSHFKQEEFNYDYKTYTFVAPVALGAMNIVSLFLAKQFELSTRMRFLIISILAPTVVVVYAYLNKVYNYTNIQWFNYIWKLYIVYLFVFNVIVYSLNKII